FPSVFYSLSLHDALPICVPLLLTVARPKICLHLFQRAEFLWSIGIIVERSRRICTSTPSFRGAAKASASASISIRIRFAISTARSEEHTSELQSLRHLVC